MFLLSIFVITLLFVKLVIINAIRPNKSEFSLYELNRRVESGHKNLKDELLREQYRGSVLSLMQVVSGLIIIVITLACIAFFGWGWGIVLAIFIGLIFKPLSHTRITRKFANGLYKNFEKPTLEFFQKNYNIKRMLSEEQSDKTVGSVQELQYLIDTSGDILSDDEKCLISNGLSFGNRKVGEIMIPRDQIVSIEKKEFLGPLVLDDLHKTGFKRMPVISEDVDHVIGILNLRGLLALDIKRSVTAEKAMEPKVYYIRQDQKLDKALAAFMKTHANILIVIDKARHTMGLLTMEDLVASLLGRRIADTFDEHDSIHAVAAGK